MAGKNTLYYGGKLEAMRFYTKSEAAGPALRAHTSRP